MIANLFDALFETTLATGAAALLVLAMRKPLLAKLGAGVAYAAWALVPVAFVAVLLPAPRIPAVSMAMIGHVAAMPSAAMLQSNAPLPWREVVLVPWALGALATIVLFWLQQCRFQNSLAGSVERSDGLRVAGGTVGLPAVVGVLRPQIVLPVDFESRYDVVERELILCHERIHVARFDLQANAVAATLRALFWFNPLLHYAARRFRRDQELACDERVVARHPQQRRSYAGAMLKTHMAASYLPLGCHWQDSTPLKERIAMLKEHTPKPMRSLAGAALVTLISLAGGYAAWAAQPQEPQAMPALPGSESADYTARIEYSRNDGEPARFFASKKFGEAFAMTEATAQGQPSITATVRPVSVKGELAFDIDFTIAQEGEPTSAPRVVIGDGRTATVRTGSEQDGKFTGINVEVQVKAHDADKALKQATPFVPPASGGKADVDTTARVEIASKNANPPIYPTEAAKQGISGKVLLLVDVASDGSVAGVEVERSEPEGVFDANTLEAVKQWKFSPAVENGKPVAGRVRVPVTFEVEKMQSAPAPAGNG